MQKKTRNTLSGFIAAGAAAALLGQPLSSFAETGHSDSGEENDWEFELLLYGWAKSVDGTSGGRDVAMDFQDQILPNLTGVLMTEFLAEKGKLLLWGNYEYTKLTFDIGDVGTSVEVPVDLPPPLPPVNVPADVTTAAEVTDVQHMFELGAGWEVLESSKWKVGLHGGVRYYDYELKGFIDPITVSVGPPINDSVSVPVGNRVIGDDWYQPFIGGRAAWHFAHKWALEGRVDFGFNPFTSDDANQSWMTEVKLAWHFTHWAGAMLGYRYVIQDFDNGKSGSDNFSWIMDEYGPTLGLLFTF